MIILRVGALGRSQYERMQHLPLARQAGWRGAEIAAIEAGHSSDGRFQAILRFVDECVRDIKVGAQTSGFRSRVRQALAMTVRPWKPPLKWRRIEWSDWLGRARSLTIRSAIRRHEFADGTRPTFYKCIASYWRKLAIEVSGFAACHMRAIPVGPLGSKTSPACKMAERHVKP